VLGWGGLVVGLAGVAGSAALSLGALADPTGSAPVPQTGRAWLFATAGALAALLLAGSLAGRLVERAELAVLIRTRTTVAGMIEELAPAHAGPDDDPVDSQPGWVYQDAAGDWYLAVAAGSSQRFVRLRDFRLGIPQPPLTLQGSVEIAVYPVAVR
jgi:hypothetical protein